MFKNYKVVVSGASDQLGEMLIKAFLDNGAFVIGLNSKNTNVISEKYRLIECNLIIAEEREKAFSVIEKHFGNSIDILVNGSPFKKNLDLRLLTQQEFDENFIVSLFSVIDISRKLYPMLRKADSGNPSVVNIASSASRSNDISNGLENLCAQSMIKLTRMMAGSYDSVRCNSVSPARMKRKEECQDIVNTILFLCSNEARFITGSDFLIDYGETAKNGAKLESKND